MAVKYWYSAANANFSTTNWYTSPPTAGGPVGTATTFSSGNDDAVFTQFSGTAVVTIAVGVTLRSLTTTGFTGTIAGTVAITISTSDASGNAILLDSSTTWTFSGPINFTATTGTHNINFNGITHGNSLNLNGVSSASSATWRLTGNLSLTHATNIALGFLNLTAGTFDANGYDVSVNGFGSNNSNTRALNMGSGNWYLNSAGTTIWNVTTSTNFTLNSSTSKIFITSTASSLTGFASGGLTYNYLEITRGGNTANTNITGGGTFGTFLDVNSTAAHNLVFTAGATYYFDQFLVKGSSSSARVAFLSTTGANAFFVKTTPGIIICEFISNTNGVTVVTPNVLTWYGGNGSISLGASSGWITGFPTVGQLLLLGTGG